MAQIGHVTQNWRVSMYAFPLGRFGERKNVFPRTQKCICRITEFAWSALDIFIVFTSSRLCTCVLHWYGQHACGKVAQRVAFLCMDNVPASENAFMEMVTDKCTRITRRNVHMESWPCILVSSDSTLC